MKKQTAEDKALDLFADLMIQKIETISKDWKQPWFNESSLTCPKNIYGRAYNGANALMLTLHCETSGYELPIFTTFNKITSLNFNPETREYLKELPRVTVNKGEKSFPVILKDLVVKHKSTGNKITVAEYKLLSADQKDEYNVRWLTSVYNVFNIAQTNIKEARPELYAKCVAYCTHKPMNTDQSFVWAAVDTMITNNKWVCPIKPTKGDNAYYSVHKDEVVVPLKEQFVDGESFYSNLLHEMAHSTGAKERLGRLKTAAFGSKEYAIEELVAELTAAVVCQKYGIGKHIKDDSATYLKSWLGSLEEDPAFIKNVLDSVKPAAAMIGKVIDELTVAPTGSDDSSEKTIEQQFQDLKKKHPDALLLFRCGDFYETYHEDAEEAAKILGITLTRRDRSTCSSYSSGNCRMLKLQDCDGGAITEDEKDMRHNHGWLYIFRSKGERQLRKTVGRWGLQSLIVPRLVSGLDN